MLKIKITCVISVSYLSMWYGKRPPSNFLNDTIWLSNLHILKYLNNTAYALGSSLFYLFSYQVQRTKRGRLLAYWEMETPKCGTEVQQPSNCFVGNGISNATQIFHSQRKRSPPHSGSCCSKLSLWGEAATLVYIQPQSSSAAFMKDHCPQIQLGRRIGLKWSHTIWGVDGVGWAFSVSEKPVLTHLAPAA